MRASERGSVTEGELVREKESVRERERLTERERQRERESVRERKSVRERDHRHHPLRSSCMLSFAIMLIFTCEPALTM